MSGMSWLNAEPGQMSWLDNEKRGGGGPMGLRDMQAEQWKRRMFTAQTGLSPDQFDEAARQKFLTNQDAAVPGAQGQGPTFDGTPDVIGKTQGFMANFKDNNQILNRQPDSGVQIPAANRAKGGIGGAYDAYLKKVADSGKLTFDDQMALTEARKAQNLTFEQRLALVKAQKDKGYGDMGATPPLEPAATPADSGSHWYNPMSWFDSKPATAMPAAVPRPATPAAGGPAPMGDLEVRQKSGRIALYDRVTGKSKGWKK